MASSAIDELAEDYKSSLEDLTFNSRWEITNLTVIAKENIQAAQAISKVIEDHIQQISPARKLPALYLLDSVAKNVGTPYTLFFGRNLYRTFMDAYSLVEPQVRRKLEEMLQTWKQPVPGSPSATPVFPSEITRKIDNALIKARTAAVQAQQKQMKEDQAKFGINRPSTPGSSSNTIGIPYRSTPTPPNAYSNPQLPPQSQKPHFQNREVNNPPNGKPSANNMPLQQIATQMHVPLPTDTPAPSLDSLHGDIESLVKETQLRFSEAPWDQEIQKKLKALLDLRSLLLTQQLPPEQIQIVREQVSKLAAPQPLPPPPPPAFPVNPVSFSNSSAANLANLLKAMPQPVPPPIPSLPGFPGMQSHQVPQNTPSAQPNIPILPMDTGNLFSSLLSAGLLPSLKPSENLPPLPPPPPPPLNNLGLSGLLQNVMSQQPKPEQPTEDRMMVALRLIDVELTSASLKTPRPHLLSILNDSLPSKCSSCARRFENSEQGRKEKAAHLDWHFRVHQRMTENAKRGQNRSWYVGEEDWIKSRDDESEHPTADSGPQVQNASTSQSQARPSAQPFVPVPNDPSLVNAVCPICKEKFETTWHPDAEEWVWMDTVKVGGRVYHATCHAEVAKDGGGTGTPRSRGSTPDVKDGGSKGKRKAEESTSQIVKTKRERI